METLDKIRTTFMNKVQLKVWTDISIRGIDYNIGEINKHFREMMQDEAIISAVAAFFTNRFTDPNFAIETETHSVIHERFAEWYKEVKRLVGEHELLDDRDADLPVGPLKEWWRVGKSPQDAAHMIAHDGI